VYIEFTLPQGAGGMTASHALSIVRKQLAVWAEKYNIPYKQKTIKYTHRVTFDNDEFYTFFTLTWNPQQSNVLRQFRIVSDLNNKI
jgi:hypothetical protein